MMRRLESYRKFLVLAADILLIALGFALSFVMRFDARVPAGQVAVFRAWLPVLVVVRLFFFYRFDLYRGVWRYASINDMLNVVKAVFAGSAVFVMVVVFGKGLVGFPRSVFVIETLLTTFFIGGSRLFLRVYREVFPTRSAAPAVRALIVGAGNTGNAVLHEIKNNFLLNYSVMGFIDDDPHKQGVSIQGVRVVGTRRDIPRIVAESGIDEIILAMPSASVPEVREIVEIGERSGARLKTVPGMGDLINGKVSFSQIREVQIEDLLGRDVVNIDAENIHGYIAGRRILVTGAGGSIGSEICRQLLRFRPSSIVLLGRGEHSIYQVYHELAPLAGDGVELIQVIGDIKDLRKVRGVFARYRPQVVFHAGANKHVPLLEKNPDEAVLANIVGTRNVIEAAEECGAEKVVCISSDKAADPVSVMGCAKRVAEMIIQSRRHGATATMGVRFGNVLGSRGSVIPLFRRQIAAGGPVTVTHPEMLRYFMTIPEAAQLVLQAGAIGSCGDIFLLDMGSPVKIVDLARQMIRLSGLEPEKDISVVFTGLRPGEKLEESLTGRNEQLFRTPHPKIFMLQAEGGPAPVSPGDIEELKRYAEAMDEPAIRRKLGEMVPAFTVRPPAG